MAPEVARQEDYGRKADIWSLGCTVLEMATGKTPWHDQFPDPVSALYHIGRLQKPPPLPSHLSLKARDFLKRCLKLFALLFLFVLIPDLWALDLDFVDKMNVGSTKQQKDHQKRDRLHQSCWNIPLSLPTTAKQTETENPTTRPRQILLLLYP